MAQCGGWWGLPMTNRAAAIGGVMLLWSVWLDEGRIKVGKIMVTPNDVQPTIQLGQDVEDSITGKQGVATARFTFINGCIRIELTSRKLSKDEGSNDELVLDEQRLLILDTSVQPVKKTAVQTKAEVPGGPRPGPTPYSRP